MVHILLLVSEKINYKVKNIIKDSIFQIESLGTYTFIIKNVNLKWQSLKLTELKEEVQIHNDSKETLS